MIKQLTLYCSFAIFLLAVGGAVTQLQAHCQKKEGLPHSGDHPHCSEPLLYPVYDVSIDGGFEYDEDGSLPTNPEGTLPGIGIDWIFDGKMVASLRPRDDVLDMGFFYGKTFDSGASRDVCFDQSLTEGEFPKEEDPNESYVAFGGFLRKHGKSTAEGMFWFWGNTGSPDTDGDVLYLLKIERYFKGTESDFGFPKDDKIMHKHTGLSR